MGPAFNILPGWRGKPITKQDVKLLSRKEVERLHEASYWRPIQDKSLPDSVDFTTFDFGVNRGTGRASKFLPAIVGAKTDGKIGPQTLNIVAMPQRRGVGKAICAKRLSFVQSLKI
jgi:lysozyme family protein